MEPSGDVRVNVMQQTAVLNSDRPRSFEEAMTRVRKEPAKAGVYLTGTIEGLSAYADPIGREALRVFDRV